MIEWHSLSDSPDMVHQDGGDDYGGECPMSDTILLWNRIDGPSTGYCRLIEGSLVYERYDATFGRNQITHWCYIVAPV
jgi:hypothetical protein